MFNHTAYDHEWAKRALAGDLEYKKYYFIFPDRTIPDAYDKTLREIFPDVRRGSFSPLSLWKEGSPAESKQLLPLSSRERGLGGEGLETLGGEGLETWG